MQPQFTSALKIHQNKKKYWQMWQMMCCDQMEQFSIYDHKNLSGSVDPMPCDTTLLKLYTAFQTPT